MLDWSIIARMWAGYGVTILILVILSVVAWLIGIVIQRTKSKPEEKSG